MAGLQLLGLNSLNIDISNSIVIGIIIAKSSPRIFKSKKKENETRGVWTFTLRDSDVDFINCTVWGSAHFVTSFDEMFHIGDVVDVISPRIKTRQIGDRNEQFQPQVSSPFQLVLNEGQSEMNIHEGDDFNKFLPLLHIPTKPPAGYFTLADVENNAQDIRDDTVDLLVAIRSILPPRTIKNKSGEEIQHREATLMDQTTTKPLKLTIWDSNTIKRSASWQPRETVLFLSDVKLEWSEFSRCVVSRINSRTVVTEDPHTPEAEALRVFAHHAPIQAKAVLDQLSLNIPDPNSIRTVMTVQQVLDRASGEEHPQFTALLYATVTHLDLDGSSRVLLYQCGGCSNMLKGYNSLCVNVDCPMASCNEVARIDISFDIRVTLTDHTGSLSNCRLNGKFAENVLECGLHEFVSMDIDSRGQLKWKLLLERCAARVVVMKGPMVSLLTCSRGDPNEIVSKLPIY